MPPETAIPEGALPTGTEPVLISSAGSTAACTATVDMTVGRSDSVSLVSTGSATGSATSLAALGWPNWRRAAASSAHMAGGSTGAAGPGATRGANTDANTVSTIPVGSGSGLGAAGTLAGVTGSSEIDFGDAAWTSGTGSGFGAVSGVSAPVDSAGAAAAARSTDGVDTDGGVAAARLDFLRAGSTSWVGSGADSTTTGSVSVVDAAAGCLVGSGSAGADGFVVSVEVCAPPELDRTTPGATSVLLCEGDDEAPAGAEGESAASVSDVDVFDVFDVFEPVSADGEAAGTCDGDGSVFGVPAESLSAADEAPASVGSAQATPGIPVATAVPTPSATASAPTRPTCLA